MVFVQEKNPLLEARQITPENIEEIKAWCEGRHIIVHHFDEETKEPFYQLEVYTDGGYYRVDQGAWLIKTSPTSRSVRVVSEERFMRDYQEDTRSWDE